MATSGDLTWPPVGTFSWPRTTDVSLTALRVFREVAERGTLTAAAAALGYTQSAVSRQIAALERALAEEG
jgi:DNA-binding MarR family transcriptional regulator